MTTGRSIRLFLADGVPNGIITAEIVNWTGHVMVAPRSRLPDLLRRAEAGRTGVYVLSGDDPEGALAPLVYIGESDNVGKRLAQHNRDEDKGFWDRVCVVTSKDPNLTKAHVRYLESRLITVAADSGRAKLVNGTAPDFGLLPESDIADMEYFVEQMRTILPVLGLDLLREPPRLSTPAIASTADAAPAVAASPVFELASTKHGLRASAREVDGDFVVLAGSQAQREWIGAHGHSYQTLLPRLVATGVLAGDGDGPFRFATDCAFRSPSAASAAVLGRQDNGRTSWRVKGSGQTYAQWQDERVAAASPAGGEE